MKKSSVERKKYVCMVLYNLAIVDKRILHYLCKKRSMDFFKNVNFAVTISDKEGNIIYMNNKSKVTFEKEKSLIGSNLKDCHSTVSWEKIQELISKSDTNAYTIEKKGVKKLIYQTPWYDDNNKVAGLIELSLVIPLEMPHYIRK